MRFEEVIQVMSTALSLREIQKNFSVWFSAVLIDKDGITIIVKTEEAFEEILRLFQLPPSVVVEDKDFWTKSFKLGNIVFETTVPEKFYQRGEK